MKLAIIRRQYTPTGGAELYLERLLNALADGGHEIHLFCESWKGSREGIDIHPLNAGGSRATRVPRFAEAVQGALAQFTCDCVFSLERTFVQDVYRAGDGLHKVWLRQRRKYAPWWRRAFVGLGGFHREMLNLELRMLTPERTGCIIVNSDMVRREIVKEYGYPEDRIHLVRNGIDVGRFQGGDRAGTRLRYGVKEEEWLILFVGSGLERKGFSHLLKPLRRLNLWLARGSVPVPYKRARLLVVGKDRPPEADGGEIIFAGPMRDVQNAYAAADIFTLLPIYEPSSNVVSEALACGLPVLTSGCNGAGELICEGVNGNVVLEPSDHHSVSQHLQNWISHPRRCAPDLDHLSITRNVSATLEILQKAAWAKGL